MNKLMRFFVFMLFSAIITIADVYALEMPTMDNGKDKNGDLIVAKTLALRCGLSSQEPNITSDCIDRLAYDYKSGVVAGLEFKNYIEERKAILNDYANAYIQKAIQQLIDAGAYKDRIDEILCNDPTKPECMSLTKDSRKEMEDNNKLAADNATIMLDAIRVRASLLNMDGLKNILYNLVLTRDVDLSNKSLASAP
jgi:hypothetical protein